MTSHPEISTHYPMRAVYDLEKDTVILRHHGVEVAEWSEEPTLSELIELIQQLGPLSGATTRWMLDLAASVEDHTQYAASDWRRYGQIGQSY